MHNPSRKIHIQSNMDQLQGPVFPQEVMPHSECSLPLDLIVHLISGTSALRVINFIRSINVRRSNSRVQNY